MTEAPPDAGQRSPGMKALKVALVLFLGYAGLVAAFESMLGYVQPSGQGTLTITTTNPDGTSHDRVLARLVSDDQIYVAANHWPRAWYRRALENPDVMVAMGDSDSTAAYRAVPVTDAEHARVDGERGRGFVFLVMTGFPPRRFLRLDPR